MLLHNNHSNDIYFSNMEFHTTIKKQITLSMKYVVTGSLGNISKPLAERLIAAGHEVTVMSSNPEKAAVKFEQKRKSARP